MKLFNYISNIKYQIIFIFFIAFYFIVYGPYGTDDVDNGYTMGLSWRIFNCEIPYRDFFLVRPPLSPLFHTLTLYIIPQNYQIIFERLFTYFLFAASSLFGALTINKTFQLNELKINPYLLATLGFIFSVRNYPAMPWHTIDGVFFASLGLYYLACYSSLFSIIVGILFLTFSALCKQSFYLLPFIGIIYISIIHKSWIKSTIALLSLILYISIFVFILIDLNIIGSFISLTTGSAKLVDLLNAGFLSYVQIESIYFILPAFLWLFFQNKVLGKFHTRKKNLLPYFFITFLLILPVIRFLRLFVLNNITYDTFFADNVAKFLLVISVLLLIRNLSLNKKWVTLWFLILISWSASLSWGFRTPVLFSVPLVFSFIYVSFHYFDVKRIKNFTIYILMLGTIIYFIEYQKPYRNLLRNKLTYKVDYLYPKLKYIKVSKEMYDKYSEFAVLHKKYGDNFKTLPGMPLFNYLTNTNSPLQMDWVFNAETNNTYNDSIINRLNKRKPYVFMEKNQQVVTINNSNEKFNSRVAFYIRVNWLKIDSTNYFDIYKSNERD